MMNALYILLAALFVAVIYAALRAWEDRRGALIAHAHREKLDAWLAHIYQGMVEGGIPLTWRNKTGAFAYSLTHEIVHLVLAALRAIEKPIAQLSYKMRLARTKNGARSVSEYLRTITPEKGEEKTALQEKSV